MLSTRVPPPLYAALAGLAMWLIDARMPIVRVASPAWMRAGWLFVGLGVALDLWSVSLFLRARTTINPLRPQRSRELVTTGPYRYTRNPMYLGLLLVLIGWACVLGSAGPLFVLPLFVWIVTAMQIVPEEAAMAERFGAAYTAYAARVPRWIGSRRRS